MAAARGAVPAGAAAPAPMDADEKALAYALGNCLGVDVSSRTRYQESNYVQALTMAGVSRWSDFICLSKNDISSLKRPAANPRDPPVDLTILEKRNLMILIALYHFSCKVVKRPLDPKNLSRRAFDIFRTTKYRPDHEVIPWDAPEEGSLLNQELVLWKKSIRPSKKDFPVLKDEAQWFKIKKKYENTLYTLELMHVITPGATIRNRELDKLQRRWFYNMLDDNMQAGSARVIVVKHRDDVDTRTCWTSIDMFYKQSQTTQHKVSALSNYITSTRLVAGDWRGTHQSFLLESLQGTSPTVQRDLRAALH